MTTLVVDHVESDAASWAFPGLVQFQGHLLRLRMVQSEARTLQAVEEPVVEE